MFHFAAHALDNSLLFVDWTEALALWEQVVRIRGTRAVCIMPNHVHLITRSGDLAPVRQAMGGFTQWRAHHRGHHGEAVWRRLDPPRALGTRQKVRQDERYVHLNPCRARLVGDPLEWPLSTHRDAVGLAIPLRRAPVQDPKRYHDYVSGDTSVSVLGTALPSTQLDPDPERALPMIWQSVAGLTRSTARALRRRGPARSLFLLAARALTDASTGRIGEFAGVSRRSVTRVPVGRTPALRVVEQVVGDQRLRPVDAVDLCGLLRRRRWVQASPSRPGPRRTSSHWGVGPG